uniref:Putative secreted protein n=1 Tax=Anopheles triannulatus TaxID=58253 RepID=A0A2M4B236_9DIPT
MLMIVGLLTTCWTPTALLDPPAPSAAPVPVPVPVPVVPPIPAPPPGYWGVASAPRKSTGAPPFVIAATVGLVPGAVPACGR